MNILGFDTSSKALTVACSNEQGLLAETSFLGLLQHSENLFRLMESVLSRTKVQLSCVDCFAIGLGPGSFTGLRIGFSVLKGFLAVEKKPVYGLSSLDLIAQGVPPLTGGRLTVVVNARRERVYASFYRFENGAFEREKAFDQLLSPEDLLDQTQAEDWWVGDALKEYGDFIRKRKPKAVFLSEDFWYPRASYLINLVRSRYKTMESLRADQLKPQYLRLSEAEEKTFGNLYPSRRSS